MNSKTLWARSQAPVVVVLSVIFALLCIAVLFKYNVISTATLAKNKDLIDVVSKVLTTAIIMFGAIASYFRFFRGRTLSPRLKMEANVSVFKATDTKNLHILSIVITNIGSVAIWNPQPYAEILYHGNTNEKNDIIDEWWSPAQEDGSANRIPMIDTGEDAQYVVQRLVPKNVFAVTYFARVGLESGHTWHRSVTVSNKIKTTEE